MRKPTVGVMVVTLLCAAMTAISVQSAQAYPTPVDFSAKTDFVTGSQPSSVAIGDLNGDGHLDLAVAYFDQPAGGVSILLGDGTGRFAPRTDYTAAGYPSSVAIGDLNGDGHLDLAVAEAYANTVSVMLGDGTGRFGPRNSFPIGGSAESVAIGDLNGDGHLDLAVADYSLSTVSVLLGDGTGRFGPRTDFVTGAQPESVAIGDLNGDGHLDLAATYIAGNGDSGGVSVLLGDGTGHFGPKTDFGADALPLSVAIGDLNGDGHVDLAVANFNSADVSVLLGDGTGAFGPHIDFASGDGSDSVAVADVNGDGQLDLIVANNNSNTVSVLLGPGFNPKTSFPTGAYPRSVAIGDLNGDGRADLAVANQIHTVSVLLNKPFVPKVPGAPTIGTAVAGDAQATVSWTAPVSDGGSPITGYVVTPYIGYSPQTPITFTSAATAETITGLNNGTTYRFAVQAVNAVGTGPPSSVSNPAAPGAPDAPTIGTAIAGDGQATVSWTAPTNEGSTPVTSYVVTPYIGYAQQPPTTFSSTATVETVTGLTDGTAYRFRVQAINGFGAGAYSKASNAVTPATVPGAPTMAQATAVYPSATVSWTPPVSNGGSSVTGYVVTPYVDGVAQSPVPFGSTSTAETITGLSDGVTYTFTVAATNAIGTGPASAPSNPVTIAPSAPGPPTIGIAVPGNGTATVSWTAPPSDGGSPIIGYVVTPYVSSWTGLPRTFNSTATTQTISGLTNGWPYRFRVQAVNALGTGNYSEDTNRVTPTAG